MSNRYLGGFITATYNPLKVPNAPTIGTATGGNAQASVTFTAPTNVGGSAITSYTVISNPGNITASGSSSPIVVTGLTNGTAYTFTVIANNVYGPSSASSISNSVTPSIPVFGTVEYLVVAGGGSGASVAVGRNWECSGGGGAGGFIETSATFYSGQTYTISIGSGGASPPVSNASVPNSGNNSSISGYSISSIAIGGGAAGGNYNNAATGGSGGGGSGSRETTGASGTSGQGYAGGNGASGSSTGIGGGGGGGANGAGNNAPSTYVAGDGGGAKSSTYFGSSYAGGGGGAARDVNGSGGGAGAGNGAIGSGNGSNASSNSGGGGGGGGYNGGIGGAGGSGIFRLRYSSALADPTSTTGSPSISTSGGYKYYTWTGSGSITF